MSEHPFAPYIRILGKGQKGSRGLSHDEAYTAMKMILAEEVEPLQLGAFLMLMRVKEETPEEVAGAVKAIRETLKLPSQRPEVDLDWSSYAGKKRILPWFLLSTILLADHGVRIFMHGASGHTEGRLYTREILPQLGIPLATTLGQAAEQIEQSNFSYLDLEQLSPRLHEIIEMRPLLGLRSPVHTIARMLNPFSAPCMMQGIFHPSYRNTHQEAGQLLQQPHMAVIKGEGGEIERNPDLPVLVQSLHEGVLGEEEWPAMFDKRHTRSDALKVEELQQVWQGRLEDSYATAAIIGTAAITLFTLGKAANRSEAEEMASTLWQERNRDRL
ncbi:MAG: glycosyl transferase family protein [Gammaproteobacteria bacterium]|nr:glycosyl transferase family protein [Gammaproteobacteria bacterium]